MPSVSRLIIGSICSPRGFTEDEDVFCVPEFGEGRTDKHFMKVEIVLPTK